MTELRKRLRNAFRSYCPAINLKVVFSWPNRLKNEFSFKDVIIKNLNSLVLPVTKKMEKRPRLGGSMYRSRKSLKHQSIIIM